MNPILSPYLLYFIGISEDLKFFLGFSSLLLGIGFLVLLIVFIVTYYFEYFESYSDKEKCLIKLAEAKKGLTILAALFTLFGAVFIAIPSQKWLIALTINSQVTPANLTRTGDALDSARQQIKRDFIDIIQSINSKDATITIPTQSSASPSPTPQVITTSSSK